MNRVGAVRACQENAERLLMRDNLIAVFPGKACRAFASCFAIATACSASDAAATSDSACSTRAPLIPCAIIGGEEASPLLYRFDTLADLLRIPYLPVTPTFPALGALGLVPAPTKWRIKFGEPITFDNYGPEAADDDLLVGRLSERVRSTIQSMLENGLQKRRSGLVLSRRYDAGTNGLRRGRGGQTARLDESHGRGSGATPVRP